MDVRRLEAILGHLKSAFDLRLDADVRIHCKDSTLFGHKWILAIHSDWLRLTLQVCGVFRFF